jgi:hypothetical protein
MITTPSSAARGNTQAGLAEELEHGLQQAQLPKGAESAAQALQNALRRWQQADARARGGSA